MITQASTEHLPAINNIYNQAVAEEGHTAHTEPISMVVREEWFRGHTPDKFPVFIFSKNNEVLGWLSISATGPAARLSMK